LIRTITRLNSAAAVRGARVGIRGIVLLAAAVLIAASCTKMDGDFAFKKFPGDSYRKIEGMPEFSSDEKVDWVFAFSRKHGEREIGVVYVKKELVLVEVQSYSAKINQASGIVYGTIKDFPPGEYQIVLTDVMNDNQEIARKGFVIYSKEEED
jgi:hypothetical protein